jgi:hypothetical protein
MRRIIILASLAATLFGGVAMASPRSENERNDQRVEERRAPEHGYSNRNERPEPRYERHEQRAGYRWVGGEWKWTGRAWSWTAGHYVRTYRR